MTAHTHRTHVKGCYRCEISKDELGFRPSKLSVLKGLLKGVKRELARTESVFAVTAESQARELVDYAKGDVDLLAQLTYLLAYGFTADQLRAVIDVKEAWNDKGSHPVHHDRMKRDLKYRMPKLGKMLDRL